MNEVSKNIAVLILALPLLFMILHDIIPHHHHGDKAAIVECAHNHDADHNEHHSDACSHEEESCDMNCCHACQFESEYTLDNSVSRISVIIPFILIHIEEASETDLESFPEFIPETFRGYSLTKFLRGPPSC